MASVIPIFMQFFLGSSFPQTTLALSKNGAEKKRTPGYLTNLVSPKIVINIQVYIDN